MSRLMHMKVKFSVLRDLWERAGRKQRARYSVPTEKIPARLSLTERRLRLHVRAMRSDRVWYLLLKTERRTDCAQNFRSATILRCLTSTYFAIKQESSAGRRKRT